MLDEMMPFKNGLVLCFILWHLVVYLERSIGGASSSALFLTSSQVQHYFKGTSKDLT